MNKKRLVLAAIGAAVGYYYATSDNPPGATAVGPVLGAIPSALGLTNTMATLAWAAEGAALGYFGSKYLPG